MGWVFIELYSQRMALKDELQLITNVDVKKVVIDCFHKPKDKSETEMLKEFVKSKNLDVDFETFKKTLIFAYGRLQERMAFVDSELQKYGSEFREAERYINKYIEGLDKVYIIDNSLNDNSKIISNNEKVEYIWNGDNLGIAYALNVAAKKAIADGYKWLLTMDQDSELQLDVLQELEKFVISSDNSKVGIISPYHDIETNKKKNPIDVEERLEVMTSGNLLNLEIYDKIGGFKDWLFIDLVDIEYCFNLRKNGYKVLRLNNVIMKHHLGDTIVHKVLWKKFICSNHNAVRRYYMVRNMKYVTNMYKKFFPGYCRYLNRVQRGQFRYVLLFEKDKINKLKFMIKGYLDYKKGIKGKIIL